MAKVYLLAALFITAITSGCSNSSPSSDGSPDSASAGSPDSAEADTSTSPALPFNQSNGWITDAEGRVLIFHGFNMVAKEPPYTLESVGFDEDDGEFLARNGFNAVRLGFMWKASEPEPGQFNEDYLNSIERTVSALGRHGVMTLLDFHQDAYHESVEGQGFPDWMVFDDGIPWIPGVPKEAQLTYQRVWDNFWGNIEGPNNTALWDHFAAFWQHVATRFRNDSNILGYDLMNEPWPGTQTPACLNPVFCPHNSTLSDFYEHVIPMIRETDSATPIYYEGSLLAGGGLAIDIDVSEPNAVLSFHNYCALTVVGALAGLPSLPALSDLSCPELEAMTFSNADRQAKNQNHPAVLTEFGSVPDLDSVSRVAQQADELLFGWMHWTYFNTGTTNFPGTPSLVLNPLLPPEGDNINLELLKVLARPYPQMISGTPIRWGFDTDSKVFDMVYTAARVDGMGVFDELAETVVFAPQIQYPQGYTAEVQGGTLKSLPNAIQVVVVANAGEQQVSIRISPNLQ